MSFEKNAEITGVPKRIDYIENEVFQSVKKYGFRKYGRTLHRFVSGDISQVINFQCGQAYRDETHLMWVNIGIRVPECFECSFEYSEIKKYYHEYECNIRSRLGEISEKNGYKLTTFDLRNDIEKTAVQITDEIISEVIPAFEVLSSRESILAHRREYAPFDTLNRHLILLEEAMIYGHRGDFGLAKDSFEQYYEWAVNNCRNRGHITYLDELGVNLGLREK